MLAKRERLIAIAAAAALSVLLLDFYVLTPLNDSREALAAQRATLERSLAQAQQTLRQSRQASRKWQDFRASGLSSDPSSSESNLLGALRNWSQQASLPLASIRPDRAARALDLSEMAFHATAEGSMRSLVSLLHQVSAAQQPVRIRELQIASKTEGADELAVQIRLSTLWEEKPSNSQSGVAKEQP